MRISTPEGSTTDHPDTGPTGERAGGRPDTGRSGFGPTRARLLVAALLPLAAWSVSFLGSYVVQDFACQAAASADRMLSPTTLPAVLLVANAVLLVICLLPAVAGQLWLRRHTMQAVDRFLARAALIGGLLFGFSIVLIGINPAVLEVCT